MTASSFIARVRARGLAFVRWPDGTLSVHGTGVTQALETAVAKHAPALIAVLVQEDRAVWRSRLPGLIDPAREARDATA